MSRISRQQLASIAEGMGPAARELVEVVDRLRLVSHDQLARLTTRDGRISAASHARSVRRTLSGLTELGALARLERRIGGVRAGSAGHVYYLGPLGQRLIAFWNGDGLVRGRVRPEPGWSFVRHRLAVSQLYVDAREAERRGDLDLLAFDVEPDCWRQALSGFGTSVMLKPDAYLRIGLGAYEDQWFIEVDLGTESRPVIRRKLQAYLDHFHSGTEQADSGVFPRVLWLTATESRMGALIDLCTGLPAEYWRLFAVNRLDRAMTVISELTADEAHGVDGAGGSS